MNRIPYSVSRSAYSTCRLSTPCSSLVSSICIGTPLTIALLSTLCPSFPSYIFIGTPLTIALLYPPPLHPPFYSQELFY